MSARKFVINAIVPALLIGASSAYAASPTPASCVFDKYAPVAVRPYSEDDSVNYVTYSLVKGAQLYVPAREGLTKEWLTASAQQAIAGANASSAQGHDLECSPSHLKDVEVRVVSAGNGFWVQLVSRDERTADTLLKWAQGIVGHNVSHSSGTAAGTH
jgi:anti-sigma factor RsiW